MTELDGRAAALCAAPAGCAFLHTVERLGLEPEAAARRATSMHLAAEVLGSLSPWTPDHDRVVADALAQGPRLVGLARTLLARPETAWWFGPVERGAQEWISRSRERPDPGRLVTPTAAPSTWERDAQKPRGGLYTSTAADGTSSALALLAEGYGDYNLPPPLVRYRLRAAADARVCEIDGPVAWHRLCARYPAAADDGRLVPDWALVVREWDGVHLTLGGLLAAEQVRVEGPTGWTEHRSWDAEQTVWLRWCFETVERLPDLPALPLSPVHTLAPPPPG